MRLSWQRRDINVGNNMTIMYSNTCLRFQISCVNPLTYQNIWTGLSQQKLELITYHQTGFFCPISCWHDCSRHSLFEIENFTFSIRSLTTSSADRDVTCKQACRPNRCCVQGDIFFMWLRILYVNHAYRHLHSHACIL